MKIAEVRNTIKKHSISELQFLVAELYKLLTKSKKEDYAIDTLIKNPVPNKKVNKKKTNRSFDEVEYEVETFISDAKNDLYFAPNNIISKKERSKWRFKVMKLYKEIVDLASDKANLEGSGILLQKLYELLCYACYIYVFSTEDPFAAIRKRQSEFLKQVLFINNKWQTKLEFISNGIKLIMRQEVDRETLHSNLVDIFIEFLTIPDHKYSCIHLADNLIQKQSFKGNKYDKQEANNILVELIFKCYAHLGEFQNAIDYYHRYAKERDDEVKLYILLARLLYGFKQTNYIIHEFEKAKSSGIEPRDTLKEIYRYFKEGGKFPIPDDVYF